MQIGSLAIGKRPVWFDVRGERLERFVIRARKRFWPDPARGVALFLFEFAEEVGPDILMAHGLTRSGLGCYVYIDEDGESAEFEQVVSVPPVRLKRIGVRTWNAPEPVVLEDIEISTDRGSLVSEFAAEEGLLLKDLASFKRLGEGTRALGLNLMTHRHACNSRCHSITQHWYTTMDEVARRYPEDGAGRTNCMYAAPGGDPVKVTVFHAQPAMLRIPQNIDVYLDRIGDKSRNMIRKAQRLGYAYRQVNPDDYLDDVLAIRTSNPLRQGKPIPEYFKIRPTRVIEEQFENTCEFHCEEFYGIFKGEVLIAYAKIFYYGELGQVDHILGHSDHLNEGVMNLLVCELVGQVIQRRPWVRAINYLYQDNARPNGGLSLFKKSIGFNPETVVVTQSGYDLRALFPDMEKESAPAVVVTSEKKSMKAGTSKALREAANSDGFMHSPRAKDRTSALEAALRMLSEAQGNLKTVSYRSAADEVSESHFDTEPHAVIFERVGFEEFQEFLSAKLKGLRKIVPKNSFLLFDFKRAPDQRYVMGGGGLARFLPGALQPRGRRVNQALTEYLSKRFKSLDMSVDDVKLGFKGSDYVVAGLIDYEHEPSYRHFDSLLILRKIR